MSGYLLLRDNKQTGPYSCEELIAKGFKAYDLIWAEGKSAGWRYPSEFPEFAKHAPVIEEQPFDRFYKKPSAASSPALGRSSQEPVKRSAQADQAPSIQTEADPLVLKIESRPAKLVAQEKKSVFVTLPADNTRKNNPEPKPEPAKKAEERSTAVPEGIIPESQKKPLEEKIEKAPVKKEEDSWAAYNLQEKSVPKTVASTPVENKAPKAVEEQKEPVYLEKTAPRSDKNQVFIRAAVAICLLLGGVVIGLAISNSKQSAQQELLNKLVKQKIEQSQQASPATSNKAPIGNTSSIESAPAEDVSAKLTPPSNEIAKPAVQEERTPSTEAIQTVKKESTVEKPTTQKEEPIVFIEKKPAEPVKKDNAAAETARKNIYNLVSVAGNKYKVGVLGGISNLELTLSNNSLYPLDQVEVIVNYHGPENRIVRKETVLISDIAAGEQKVVAVPKSKRGVSVTYSVNKINSKALGLAHAGL